MLFIVTSDRFSEGLIKPDLILLLRRILDGYPDNGQILKELIQNAEDAGATEVKFLLDEGSYPSQNLYSPELEKFQGPALYAFNNSEFSDVDWRGICLLHDSVKKDDSEKIGRFGLGFKSVFHMTDFPGILSGYGIGFIDPYERYFSNPRTGDRSSCKLWDLENSQDRMKMQAMWDQFQPFCQNMFYSGDLRHHLENGYSNRTLLRFPLRPQQNDGSNRLSNKAYTTEAVKNLFRSLEVEAKEILLFLLKLQKVEAYVKSSDGSQTLFFSICKTTEEIPIPRGLSDQRTIIRLNLANIETIISSNQMVRTITKFLILFYENLMSNLPDIDSISAKLGVAKGVGLALNLADIKNLSSGKISAAEWSKQGQLFCFLPLPKRTESETGFAFHIHGCFIVDQNRSKIKILQNFNQGNLAEDLQWNTYLMHRAIPNAMAAFCMILSSFEIGVNPQIRSNITGKRNTVYTIMPHPDCVRKDWEQTMLEFYNLVFNNSYNMWVVTPGNVQHTAIDDDTYFGLWLENNNPDQVIHEVVRMAEKKVIYVAENVLIALRKRSKRLKAREISPNSVADILKHQTDVFSQLQSHERTAILWYLFSVDLNSNVSAVINRIESLELLPLENGTWTKFQLRIENATGIFISSNEHSINLLPGLGHYFLRTEISDELMTAMKLIADKETTQLTYMTQVSFMNLLQQVRGLQPSNDVIISYEIAPFNHLYLENLWNYFRRTINLPMLESRFFHIIPLNSSLKTMVLFSSHLPLLIGEASVDQRVVLCCQTLGIIVLENFPGYIRECQDLIGKYVFSFNAYGIFECIQRLGVTVQEIVSRLNSISPDLRIAFRKFVGVHLESLSIEQVRVLRQLPLFETVNGNGAVYAQLVSAASADYVGVVNFASRIRLPAVVIQIMDDETMHFATRIGVTLYSAADILKCIVLPSIRNANESNTTEIEQIMITIFQDFGDILNDQSFLNENIYNISFIPSTCNSGKLKRACDLFDSNDPILTTLLSGGGKFPTGVLASDEYRPILIRLGLKSLNDMNIVDIVAAAEFVGKHPNDENCTTMMNFIEQVGQSKFHKGQHLNQMKNLQKYRWVKADNVPPEKYPVGLRFYSEYSAPSHICSRQYCNLIGSISSTVDTERWPNLSKLFGWCDVPNIEDIIKHFISVINFSNSISGSVDNRSNLISSIQEVTISIYQELNRRAKQQSLTQKFKNKLLEVSCIFIEGKFVSPTICAKDYYRGQECFPWICGLPKTMKENFSDMIKWLGIKEKFETGDFIRALKAVHGTKSTTPLNDLELKIVINIIQDLASSIKSHENELIYVPDINRILRETNTLWLRTSATLNAEVELDGKVECHSDISLENGTLLGITTKEKIILEPFTESFGPTDKVANRIKRILKTTPFGIETFKELIRNADYAGATEVQIILDTRKLTSNEGWKISHGPAVAIYNNMPFTAEDLEKIQSFDEGNQKHDATRTEQCALGFNAVYHLTDVPSLLTTVDTERVLCVFDPTHKFICETNEGSGNQYSNIEVLKSNFPDSFLGYFEEEFSQTGGSLFRLPLRTGASDLADSNPAIKPKSIESSLLKWKDELSLQLLFVNNITQISVKKTNQYTRRLDILYCLRSEKLGLYNEPFTEFDMFLDYCKQSSNSDIDRSNVETIALSREVSYKLRLKSNDNLDNFAKDYIVVQRFDLNDKNIPKSILGLHRAGKLPALPIGGVAFKLLTHHDEIQNKINPTKLFFTLPLDEELNLPVHINGSWYFDNDIRLPSLKATGQRETWNNYLIENVISEAYKTLLHVAKGLMERDIISLEFYMKLFPDVLESNPESVISKALYKRIRACELLPVQRISKNDPVTWCDLTSGYFDTIEDQEDDNILKLILNRSGFYLFESNAKLYENCLKSGPGVEVKLASPERVLSFYKTKNQDVFQFCKSLNNCSELTAVLCVLNYCTAFKNLKTHLLETPLLVTQDGSVTRFDENRKLFVTKYPSIIPHEQQLLVHTEIADALSLYPLDHSVKNLKSTKGGNEENMRICRHLTISDFEKFLQSLFGSDHMLNDNSKIVVPFNSLSDALKPHLEEHLHDKNWHYSWLEMVWKFLEDEVSRTDGLKDEHNARNCLDVLNSWHLLPVYFAEDDGTRAEYLMPMSKCQRIMSEEYIKKRLLSLHEILLKIRMPFLLCTSDNQIKYDTKLIRLLSGMETCTTADLLVGALSGLDLENTTLSRKDQKILLNYFNANVKEFKLLEMARSTIRKLPFYEIINKHIISLQSGYTIFVLPRDSNRPPIDLQNYIAEADNIIFLTNDGSCEHLLKFLDCKILSESELYLRFILNSLLSRNCKDFLRHLLYIRDTLFDIEPEFKPVLSELEFIEDHRYEGRKKASFYFDPRVKLFQCMKDICPIPPMPFYDKENYDDYQWLDFLKKCGLVSQVEDRHILQFAYHIEDKFKDCNQTDPDSSSHILLHYIANNVESISKKCWNELKLIKFIEGHQQRNYNKSLSMIRLMDSHLYKDRNLVYTLGNILPSSLSIVCSKDQLKILYNVAEIKNYPNVDDVVQNLVNVSQENVNKPQSLESAKELCQICVDSFEFLEKIVAAGNFTEENKDKLMKASCIAIDMEDFFGLVPPSKVVFNAYRQFHPYLYILPTEYQHFSSIMRSLDIEEDATVERYIHILNEIKSDFSGILPPPLLELAKDAVRGLFNALNKNITTDHFKKDVKLYLPGYVLGQDPTDLSLHKSNGIIIINDNKIDLDRLKKNYSRPLFGWNFSKPDDLSRERFEEKIQLIPEKHRPKFLSQVIYEKLVDDENAYTIHGELQSKFRSDQFHNAIVRLARESRRISNEGGELQSLDQALKGLNNFSVLVCDTLETELYDIFDSKNCCKIVDSKENVPYFIKGAKVFLSRNGSQKVSKDVLNSKLAEVLNRVTMNCLSNVMHKIPAILNCDPDSMEKCLNDLNVPQLEIDEPIYCGPSNDIQLPSEPDLNAALVWLERAEYDLKSAENDLIGDVKCYEWSCNKCYMAAEKAIRAILLAINGGKPKSHNLMELICNIPYSKDEDQRNLVTKLTPVVRDLNELAEGFSSMNSTSAYDSTAQNRIDEENVNEVKRCTNSIIEFAREHVQMLLN